METIVHLLRHGEVHNPEGILYGRLPGYHLSALGRTMAQRVAESIGDRDIVAVVASPLERAQETAQPLGRVRETGVGVDERLVESSNIFEGRPFSVGRGLIRRPSAWPYLWNPFRPSWGEPYVEVASRMWGAILDARAQVEGHEVVLVSHQLPIWIARLRAEGRRFVHDPRRRQCTVCSVTSLHFEDEHLVRVDYSEPAVDLIPVRDRGANFSSGGAVDGFGNPIDEHHPPT